MTTRIPRTTLACVDTRYPHLAVRALEVSLRQCSYESVKFFTDDAQPLAGADPRIEFVRIPRLESSAGYSRYVLKELAPHVETDFVQVIQWDGYVIRGNAWSDAFLDYDYIGARWWFRPDGENVGNGGFSLRSRKLLEALHDDDGIVAMDPEDDAICLVHRERLVERHGIRFATPDVADRYSFEGTLPSGKEFGFHRHFNFPYFHGEAELAAMLETIPAADFSSAASVTMIEKLAALGRREEALRYARRIRAQADAYRAIPAEFRAKLERLVLGLVPRGQACLCGSGLAYKRCCGAIEKWAGS